MERLTKRTENGYAYFKRKCFDENVLDAGMVAKRLAELEDKIESGLLIELPCKIGDTMYGISPPLHIEKTKLSEVCYEVVTKDGHHLIGHFGISLFTDKSEAEHRLAELEGGL